jgi:hypothetical protein
MFDFYQLLEKGSFLSRSLIWNTTIHTICRILTGHKSLISKAGLSRPAILTGAFG